MVVDMRSYISLLCVVCSCLFLMACDHRPEVIVYVSLDRNLSEPILNSFTQQTGVTVKAVYDSEANKTTGLVNRLLAEKAKPRADVFWNNEFARSLILKDKGILASYTSPSIGQRHAMNFDPNGYWTGFAARARVIIVNTNLLEEKDIPQRLDDFTNPQWKGKVAIADPHFGTTGTHLSALLSVWGDEQFQAWLQGMKTNDVAVLPGNAQVRDKVSSGEYAFGLTDTDDANAAILDGKPVKMIFPDQQNTQLGVMIIPNTLSLIKGAPNSDNGKRLIDFLLSPQVEAKLAAGRGAQIPLLAGVKGPQNVPPIDTLRQMSFDHRQVGQHFQKMLEYYRKLWR